MTQALELKGRERVLEIGTGSGYQTAILAKLADRVFLSNAWPYWLPVRGRFWTGSTVITLPSVWATVLTGWKEEAPFDAIITTAAAPQVPQYLVDQLIPGGRLIVPVGSRDVQTLYKFTRSTENPAELKKEDLGGCRFVSLIGESGWKE